MLIAFTGPKGSGKSTAMRGAVKQLVTWDEFTAPDAVVTSGCFVHIYFAETLKKMISCIDPSLLSQDAKEKPSALLNGKSPRWAMQTLGTEWGRDCIHENLWVDIWARKARKAMAEGMHVLVDDLRFVNEYAALKELGGVVVAVDRPGVMRDTSHASEAYDVPADFRLRNNGALDDLQTVARRFVNHLIHMEEK